MKIAIASLLPTNDLHLASFLHRRLKVPLGQVRAQLARGSTAAFYACSLYGNDHVQCDAEIRDILSAFSERGIHIQAWEMEGQELPGVLEFDPRSWEPLEEQHLLNALDSADGRYA